TVIGRFRTADMTEQPEWREALGTLLVLLAPIAPHISEELWHRLPDTDDSVHVQPWPVADETALVTEALTIAVQVGGRLRGQVEVPADAGKDAVLDAARSEPNVARYLEGQELVREIFVPGRLVNFVVKPA
ncbi:MAG TPA: class I tRNA ligase family protein, partial [Deinococcales bacterium]|nr:class I tRNA ligase family protein [Deinococcales bacterium]